MLSLFKRYPVAGCLFLFSLWLLWTEPCYRLTIGEPSSQSVHLRNTGTAPSSPAAEYSRHDLPESATSRIESLPIQQIRVGMRLPAQNPELSDRQRQSFVEPSPATWRLMEIEHTKPAGGVLKIQMLRPIQWIHDQNLHAGCPFQINMPELGAQGPARLVALHPCPEIQSGPGHVVLSTFAHPATHQIVNVTIGQGDQAETLGVTETHPFWSVDQQAFVPVGTLMTGSQVLTADGQTRIISSILPRPGPPQQVYNLEVNGEHVYYVGNQQLLVHNSCGPFVYSVVDSKGRPVYIGTGTSERTNSAMKRVADALGYGSVDQLEEAGFIFLRQDMGGKPAARAAENWLLLQARKAGMEFTPIGGDFIDGNLLNKKWGTDWTRKAANNEDWFNGFWSEYADRTHPGWSNIGNWFTF